MSPIHSQRPTCCCPEPWTDICPEDSMKEFTRYAALSVYAAEKWMQSQRPASPTTSWRWHCPGEPRCQSINCLAWGQIAHILCYLSLASFWVCGDVLCQLCHAHPGMGNPQTRPASTQWPMEQDAELFAVPLQVPQGFLKALAVFLPLRKEKAAFFNANPQPPGRHPGPRPRRKGTQAGKAPKGRCLARFSPVG